MVAHVWLSVFYVWLSVLFVSAYQLFLLSRKGERGSKLLVWGFLCISFLSIPFLSSTLSERRLTYFRRSRNEQIYSQSNRYDGLPELRLMQPQPIKYGKWSKTFSRWCYKCFAWTPDKTKSRRCRRLLWRYRDDTTQPARNDATTSFSNANFW